MQPASSVVDLGTQARRKQLDRLEREERLGALQIELANNKVVRLSQLRAFARVVRYPQLCIQTQRQPMPAGLGCHTLQFGRTTLVWVATLGAPHHRLSAGG